MFVFTLRLILQKKNQKGNSQLKVEKYRQQLTLSQIYQHDRSFIYMIIAQVRLTTPTAQAVGF
jgi:hypothetical protein